MSREKNIIAPTIIVMFGATGDLTTNKLIPSLFDLFQKGFLPSLFKIIGVARREFSDAGYQQFAREALEKKKKVLDPETLQKFLSCISYSVGSFDEGECYDHLKVSLKKQEDSLGVCTNKLFYFAVQPSYYQTIAENLAASGLTEACSEETGWTRILIEKPFGNDIETAQELDSELGKLFREEQIFRIDHYLAKEALQNILMFRFSNVLFEPLWNKDHIEKITFTLYETRGTEGRGAFYEDTGALRDVGQNHLLQMLAFIAMEDPGELSALHIRKKRARVLEAIRPFTETTTNEETLIRGQYEGYLDVPSVAKDSRVETYFKMKTFIDNSRWNGVPFYFESGKALHEDKVEIKVYFKKTIACLCPPGTEDQRQNVLTFRIQPNESISVLFWVKKPGISLKLESKELSFVYRESPSAELIADAYEKVLFDGIAGDQTLFTSTEEVAASWRFITPILELWKKLPLHTYQKGSNGPEVNLP